VYLPEDYLDVDAVRDLDPHELPEGALFGIQLDEPLVDAHLPVVPGLRTAAARRLPHGDLEPLCRQGDWAGYLGARPLGYLLYLVADVFYVLDAWREQPDPCLLRYSNHPRCRFCGV